MNTNRKRMVRASQNSTVNRNESTSENAFFHFLGLSPEEELLSYVTLCLSIYNNPYVCECVYVFVYESIRFHFFLLLLLCCLSVDFLMWSDTVKIKIVSLKYYLIELCPWSSTWSCHPCERVEQNPNQFLKYEESLILCERLRSIS